MNAHSMYADIGRNSLLNPHLVFRRKLLPLALLVVLNFLACESKEEAHPDGLTYPLETAQLVSHVTSGIISPDAGIKVRFVSPVVRDNLVGSSLKIDVFSFDPALEGNTKWEDRQTLVFMPSQEMPLRQSYDGVLDLPTLLPEHKDVESLHPLEFRFSIAGREINRAEGDFELISENDPENLKLAGMVEFTRKTDLEVLKRAATMKLDARKLEINWSEDAEGKRFTFTCSGITRTAQDKKYVLKLDKGPLEISADYESTYTLSSRKVMRVMNVTRVAEGENPGVILEFSDELDPRQDLAGLIRVEPAVNLKTKVIDKKAYLSGPFQHGQEYTLTASRGIRSRWATVSNLEFSETVNFDDLKPQLKFSSNGVFLPNANQRKVHFQTLNVSAVNLEVKRVFENNLGQFLQTEELHSASDRNDNFNYSYVSRVGVIVYNKKLAIGPERNVWKQHELDLGSLIGPADRGLYLLHLSFESKDMLYGDLAENDERQNQYYYGEEYYSNPYSGGYIGAHGRIYKPLILSDIGLTMKKAHESYLIYATDIRDARPLSGVQVYLMSYQNQLIQSAATDGQGYVRLEGISDDVFYLSAEKNGQRGVIKLNEMGWNLSTFDTDGELSVPGGLRAFIYTERGVYRPGDTANISVIVRNDEQTFPDNHPVGIKIFNPRNQIVFEQTLRQGRDGFYNFSFQSKMEDPTGNWPVEIVAGSATFRHQLKIETVVPYRLKVFIEPEKTELTARDASLKLDLRSTYLFGAPAAGLNAELDIRLKSQPKNFPGYKGFVFNNEGMAFAEVEKRVFSGALDGDGRIAINWTIPRLEIAPSALMAQVSARVYEKGGRANLNSVNIAVNPYENYVGIQRPDTRWGYITIGQAANFPVVLVSPQGDPVPGRQLTWRIYRSARYWWWEYDSEDEFRVRYKSDESTHLVAEGTMTSRGIPDPVSFAPEGNGHYLLEVQDGESGHTAGIFFEASFWGSSGSNDKDAGILTLQTDKSQYFIGDQAKISFPVPEEGSILVSIERGQEVLNARWYNAADAEKEMTIPISIVESMAPTTYVAVSIIQPHEQTLNDRPIRMYGVVPLNIEDRATRLPLKIDMPDELQANQNFDVQIQTTDRKAAQFTIAVVDEGLLDLTRFTTPDAWSHFFKKLRLGVISYDVFNHIIGANKGDIFKTFSIGGDADDSYRQSQLDSGKKKRFKPVAMFKGPLETDSKGRATVSFDMPNYIGAVRVMVVAADNNSFGNAEKTVPVKTPLMVLPTLPRVLGPAEKFTVPASVFAMAEDIKTARVSIRVEGPLSVVSESRQTLSFAQPGEKDCYFTIATEPAVGEAKVIIEATSGEEVSRYETDINVRAASPRIYDSEQKFIDNGQKATFTIPDRGIPGSNSASFGIRQRPNMDFTHRLRWLIQYPYGCIEQTVSAVFPQLYLKDFLKDAGELKDSEARIDDNINRGIKRLNRFRLASGAFTYWPGNDNPAEWATLYAGHFLIEARKLGYSVPEDMMSDWLSYGNSRTLGQHKNQLATVYRLYLLALAGQPNTAAMNIQKENNLMSMGDREKWLLAAAFKLAGNDAAASQILRAAKTEVKEDKSYAYTYGSALRDRALILNSLVLFEDWQKADELATLISDALSSRNWHSTQTLAFSLLAVGRYLNALDVNTDEEPRMAGRVILPGGESIPFDTGERVWEIAVDRGFGEQLTVELDSKTTLKRVYAVLNWNGVPLQSDVGDEQKNLGLDVEWLNEDGLRIRPEEIRQGSTFWGHFTINGPSGSIDLEECALVQVLPSGWEIENTRLSGEDLPSWTRRYKLNQEEYLDVRDDRVMWFFDLRSRAKLDFVVKLNAVTAGEFQLPPTIAEAMYDDTYKATRAGGSVVVTPQEEK